MKIAVVAYEMEGDRTGVGRYLEGLLTGVAQTEDTSHWQLFFKGEPFDHPLWTSPTVGGARFEPLFDHRPDARPIFWEQLRLPGLIRRAKPDLVFSPAYSLPSATRAPGVVTVHDLSFEILGNEFSRRERWRRRLLARRAVRRARRVLTDTEGISRDLMRLYKVPYDNISIVPLGIDDRFFDASDVADQPEVAERLAVYGIQSPYLLYVGSILDRRHVELVIAAFGAVAEQNPDLSLVIAGRNRLRRRQNLDNWIAASGVGDRIVGVGYVAEEDLVPLYRQATLSYYLSTYEGYGLPPLESLAAGTPPVVSRGLALDELWPNYPYRVVTLDAGAVTRVTRTGLEDADQRRQVAAQGVERMRRLEWKRAAEIFLEEIHRV